MLHDLDLAYSHLSSSLYTLALSHCTLRSVCSPSALLTKGQAFVLLVSRAWDTLSLHASDLHFYLFLEPQLKYHLL